MAIQTSSLATAGNLTRYETAYRKHLMETMTYDQLATTNYRTFEPRGDTIQIAWANKLTPRPTTAVGSQTSDFDPQTMTDTTRSMTRQWLADGVKAHELVRLRSSLDPMGELLGLVSQLASETIDALARRIATEGDFVIYGDNTHSTRVTLDLGTAGDRMNLDRFTEVKAVLGAWQTDAGLFVIMDDFAFQDLLTTSSGLLTNRQAYTEEGKKMLYNWELATLAGIKIVVSPYAKAFYGSGAANASVVNTTLATAVTAGSNSAGSPYIEVAANTNISTSKWLTLGTPQATTETDANLTNEIVRVASVSGTTITIIGKGPGGGLLYSHAVGDAVKNDDTVHCSIFGRSDSLAVDFGEYGRFGKLVPKFEDGNAKQWTTASFKYYGNYGRFDTARLVRVETSASGQ